MVALRTVSTSWHAASMSKLKPIGYECNENINQFTYGCQMLARVLVPVEQLW